MASVTSQELVVKFTGDTRGLNDATARARSTLDGVSKSALNAGTAIKGMIAAVGVQQIYNVATATLNWADDLGDLAQTLGVTTEKVQALQYAAIANGSSVNEVNSAMLRFTQSVGDAATAGGPLLERFQSLGISITDMNGQVMTLDQILPQVADRIANAGSAQEKLSIATDFFGRSAAPSMVRMLGEGSQKLTELEQAARNAGAVLSDEVVKAAAATNAQFELLSQTISVNLKGALLVGIDYFGQLKDAAIDTADYLNEKLFGIVRPEVMATPWEPQAEVLARPIGYGTSGGPTAMRRASSGSNSRGVGSSPYSGMASSPTDIKILTTEAPKAARELDGVKRQIIAIDNAAQDMREQIGDTFKDFAMSVGRGEDALDSLRRVALNVISDIAENMMTMSYGGKSGGGIAGTIAGFLGDSLGGMFGGKTGNKVPAFATGISRVAETGLAVVHAGEKITPARDSRSGNSMVNQTINISTGVQQTVRAEIQRMLPQLQMAAVGGVQNARQRGMMGA